MNTNELLDYETPEIQVIEVELEEGYTASAGGEKGNWRSSSYDDFYYE